MEGELFPARRLLGNTGGKRLVYEVTVITQREKEPLTELYQCSSMHFTGNLMILTKYEQFNYSDHRTLATGDVFVRALTDRHAVHIREIDIQLRYYQ